MQAYIILCQKVRFQHAPVTARELITRVTFNLAMHKRDININCSMLVFGCLVIFWFRLMFGRLRVLSYNDKLLR